MLEWKALYNVNLQWTQHFTTGLTLLKGPPCIAVQLYDDMRHIVFIYCFRHYRSFVTLSIYGQWSFSQHPIYQAREPHFVI